MSFAPEHALAARDLAAAYSQGARRTEVLRGVEVSLAAGEVALFHGPSGSGKTTLLSILGGLRTPERGTVLVGAQDLYALSAEERACARLELIGFVFQSFRLLAALDAVENVALPLRLAGCGADTARARARAALEHVGMLDRALHRPAELSGGEQQRVAIARAIARRPRILLADEPTANLDEANSLAIAELLADAARTDGCAVAIVTHDTRLYPYAHRRYSLSHGTLADEIVA